MLNPRAQLPTAKSEGSESEATTQASPPSEETNHATKAAAKTVSPLIAKDVQTANFQILLPLKPSFL
jgi:hypothetical protein